VFQRLDSLAGVISKTAVNAYC